MAGKSVDEFLITIGEMGRFQKTRLAMLYPMIIPTTFHALIMFFVAHEAPWQCALNSTSCNLQGQFVPGDTDYDFRCRLNRSDWEFSTDHEGPRTSIVSEFDLVCENSVYGWLAKSTQFFGLTVCSIPLGIISDRYGRLYPLYPSLIAMCVAGFGAAFITQYWQFLITRFIIGSSLSAIMVSLMVLVSEYVGTRYRSHSIIMLWNVWAVSYLALGGIGYVVREWRTFMIICSAPWILLLVFWKFIPESMRWHATHNQTEKAERTLRLIAKVNKKDYPIEQLSVHAPEKSASCLLLFTKCTLAVNMCIQGFAWFTNSLVYYGAAFGAGDFGGNMYFNFVLSGLVEIPAYSFGIYSCKRFGRKKTTIYFMVLAGVACVIVSLIPAGTERTDYIAGRVTGGMIGKGAIATSFGALPVWSAELFPTVLRCSALAILEVLISLGGFAAPFLLEAKRIHTVLPFAVMGVFAVTSALLCCVQPETKYQETAETLEIESKKGNKRSSAKHEELQDILKMSDPV